jgi:hypothetical protein
MTISKFDAPLSASCQEFLEAAQAPRRGKAAIMRLSEKRHGTHTQKECGDRDRCTSMKAKARKEGKVRKGSLHTLHVVLY